MREALEGSMAIARAVSLCKPDVVAAYPITPQTHIVENISKLVAEDNLHTELVSVESEFSAASVVLGAAAAGARAYTASSSQGILLMAEVLFNAAGMRIPLVMTVANRALSAPLSIWNDHSDSMAVRDSGWIQIHAADNQESVDATIQAFRIAETCELPVMVCLDGFILTHTMEVIDMPNAEMVNEFLPPIDFNRRLDTSSPKSLGMLVAPDFFAEVRHSHHAAMEKALRVIETADKDWEKISGRSAGGLLQIKGDKKSKIGIMTMGSTFGTLEVGFERFADECGAARLIKLRVFRPLPKQAIIDAVLGLDELIVIDRAISPGMGGILGCEIKAALSGMKKAPKIHNFAIGLGGRDIQDSVYRDLLNAIKTENPNFILDADLEKLLPEDR